MPPITVSGVRSLSLRQALSRHKTSSSMATSMRHDPLATPTTIDYPGQHDFVVVASDGVRFNLSGTVLAGTSNFFADMFTFPEPSSSTQSPEGRTVSASENHVVLDALFAISYSHPERPKPNIVTFAQIAELIRVAEKYSMRPALDYLSSHLVLPRIQGTTISQPFTVTHALATLSLSLTHGFSIPARLALKEVVNTGNSIWDVDFDDPALDGVTLDFRTLKMIHRERKSRADAYKAFIQSLQPCQGCSLHVRNWKADLLKKFEEAPNSAAFSIAFRAGWVCAQCSRNLVSFNSSAFTTFIVLQESTLPELR